jgi:hypothetical protein
VLSRHSNKLVWVLLLATFSVQRLVCRGGTEPCTSCTSCSLLNMHLVCAVCSLTLSQFNPLLEEVALIRESGQLMTSIAPAEGKLPAESGQVSSAWTALFLFDCGPLLAQLLFGVSCCTTLLVRPYITGS